MKRRLVYGIKEVTKHIKLRKVKCVLIATDIENVEAEGGLNEALNNLKTLSSNHNIPCVFALSRKALGKVCRKPSFISCVGIFNYEGSEANFKSLVGLQATCEKDYLDHREQLMQKLCDSEVKLVLEVGKSPDSLQMIRQTIRNRLLNTVDKEIQLSLDVLAVESSEHSQSENG